MSKEQKSIVQILSATISALKRIIIIIKESCSDDDDAPPLHKKQGYIYKTISAIRDSQLNDFLNLTTNELKILDYIIRYRALTARNLRAFLRVKRRQIYYYLERLHSEGFITYTAVPLGDGPPTRFYHFANLTQEQLRVIVTLEKKQTQKQKQEEPDREIYKCSYCGGLLPLPPGRTKPFARCPHCGFKKKKEWIRIDHSEIVQDR